MLKGNRQYKCMHGREGVLCVIKNEKVGGLAACKHCAGVNKLVKLPTSISDLDKYTLVFPTSSYFSQKLDWYDFYLG